MQQLKQSLPSLASLSSVCAWCQQGIEVLPEPDVLQPRTAQCPQCRRTIRLVSIELAHSTVDVSRRTMYIWIEKGLVRTVRLASGRSLICFSSLFRAQKNRAEV